MLADLGYLGTAAITGTRNHPTVHTAATVLLVLGVPGRAVMGIMGWSNSAIRQVRRE